MRTLVDIPDLQVDALARICQHRKVSRAEAVRQAIAQYIADNTQGSEDAFGLWQEQQVDGLVYQHQVRSEW